MQYLTEQGCTRPFDGKDYVLVIDWLLYRATSLTYQDRGNALTVPRPSYIVFVAEEYTQAAEEFKAQIEAEREMQRIDENTDCTCKRLLGKTQD